MKGPKLDSSIYNSLVHDKTHISDQWRKIRLVNKQCWDSRLILEESKCSTSH